MLIISHPLFILMPYIIISLSNRLTVCLSGLYDRVSIGVHGSACSCGGYCDGGDGKTSHVGLVARKLCVQQSQKERIYILSIPTANNATTGGYYYHQQLCAVIICSFPRPIFSDSVNSTIQICQYPTNDSCFDVGMSR